MRIAFLIANGIVASESFCCSFLAIGVGLLSISRFTDATVRPSSLPSVSPISFVKYGNFSDEQKDAIVTIEFILENTKITDSVYRVTRATVIKFITGKRSTPVPTSTTTTTTVAATTATTTTTTTVTTRRPTTIATTTAATTAAPLRPASIRLTSLIVTVIFPPQKKRREVTDSDYVEEDVHFVEVELAITSGSILRMPLYINKEGHSYPGDKLFSDLVHLNATGVLGNQTGATIQRIYIGMPQDTRDHMIKNHFVIWIPIVCAIVLLTIIAVAFYMMNRR